MEIMSGVIAITEEKKGVRNMKTACQFVQEEIEALEFNLNSVLEIAKLNNLSKAGAEMAAGIVETLTKVKEQLLGKKIDEVYSVVTKLPLLYFQIHKIK